jgi:hypothetical protein
MGSLRTPEDKWAFIFPCVFFFGEESCDVNSEIDKCVSFIEVQLERGDPSSCGFVFRFVAMVTALQNIVLTSSSYSYLSL